MSALQNAPAKDTDGNYLAVCQARETVENGLRLDAVGNFISIAVLNTQRTACLVGLVGTLVLGMPAVGSGQGTVADDRAALEALYDATNGANWSSNDNWKTDEPLGQWYGVRTNSDGRVTRLDLSENQLSGTIPAEIGNLTSLTDLLLGRNQLSGMIPAEIGSLTSLQDLELHLNQLSGTIPAEIWNLTSLTTLSLSFNQLSGTIPVEIGNLTSLEHLLLGHNQLSGTIPAEIGNLTSLISLDLEDNQLSGTIPAEIGNLPLSVLGLKDNQLSGTIPAEIGNLTLLHLTVDIDTGLCLAPDFDLTSQFATATGLPVCSGTPTPTDPGDDRAALEALYDATNGANWSSNDNWKTDEPLGQWFGVRINNSDGRVTRLDLSHNRLSGTIPAEIGNLTSLTELELGFNELSGTIPAEIGNLTSLRRLDLGFNYELSGTIPAEIGNLTSLTNLNLGINELSGTIPAEIGNLTSLTGLDLGNNQLSGTIPAEIGSKTSLTWLELQDNQLSGTIPAELGNLTRLFFLSVDTDTGLCLAPDFDLTSPFATRSGLPVCSTEPSGTPTPKDPPVVQMAVDDAIAAPTNGEGLRTGGAPVTVRFDALFTFPSSAASAVTYAGTTFSVSSTAPGVVSVSTTDAGPGVVLTPGPDAGTAAVTVDARPEGQPAATPVASVMFEVEVNTDDTTAPTVTITSAASEPVSGPFPITVTFSEPVTGFELADLVVGNGSASELQGTEASYTATVTPTASGAVTVDIAAGAAEDGAGNPSAAADQFSITADLTPVDTTAPTVTITSAASEPVSGPFPITVTFSEPVTGFELPDLVVGNGSASELQGTEASYTATVTPTASGAVTVDIAAGAAEGGAGNPSAAADQFSITADLTPVPALPLAGAVALAALLLVGGIRRRRGVLTT